VPNSTGPNCGSQASTAYLFTTAERARDVRQPPVYVLNHSQHNFRRRTTQEDLDDIEDWTDRAAKCAESSHSGIPSLAGTGAPSRSDPTQQFNGLQL
jgi:hypothetical protein